MIPDARCIKRNTVALGDRQKRRVAEQNGIIAMKNALDPNNAFIAAVGVISRPFAEGPLRMRLLLGRRHIAFNDNFRSRRDRQSGIRRTNDFEWRATQCTGIFVFADPRLGCRRRRHPGGGLAAEHHGNWTSAAGLPILARDLLAVFVLDNPESQAIFADDARSVGADVDPAALRIFDDHHVTGADLTAAIVLVPFWRRENI